VLAPLVLRSNSASVWRNDVPVCIEQIIDVILFLSNKKASLFLGKNILARSEFRRYAAVRSK
jgi:hypothetical protein